MKWRLIIRNGDKVIFTDDILEWEIADRIAQWQRLSDKQQQTITVEVSQSFMWTLEPKAKPHLENPVKNVDPFVDIENMADG